MPNIKLLISLFVSFNQEALWCQKCLKAKKKQKKTCRTSRMFSLRPALFVSLSLHRWRENQALISCCTVSSRRNSNHLVLSSRIPAGFFLTDFRLLMWCHCATPVSCNNPPRPVCPPCPAGARRGSQTCNKQEEPRRDLGKNGHFSQPSENVWSDGLNYWGQWLPPLDRFVCGRGSLALILEDVAPPRGTANGERLIRAPCVKRRDWQKHNLGGIFTEYSLNMIMRKTIWFHFYINHR